MRFVADVNTTDGGLHVFSGTASSAALDCVAGKSVSMFDVRRGGRRSFLLPPSQMALGCRFLQRAGSLFARAPFQATDFFEAVPLLALLQDTFKFI
jgi:hypothetical protein